MDASMIMYSRTYYTILSIFLILLSTTNSRSFSRASSALCFLSRKLPRETLQFANELAQNTASVDVFIVVDNNTVRHRPASSSRVRILQFDETVCLQHGFRLATSFVSLTNCTAWDKAIYYFTREATSYSFVWFVEDDVFIPSTQAFFALHDLYSSSSDLVTPSVGYNRNGATTGWFHWRKPPTKLVLPWAHSLVCAMGCSRRLLSAVDQWVHWRGYLSFHEILFHTLALHDGNMKVVTPHELDTIIYRSNYSFQQIEAKPNNWWHPKKLLSVHQLWRSLLVEKSSMKEKTVVKKLDSIQKYLMNRETDEKSTYDVAREMAQLEVRFEAVIGQRNASSRRELRTEFLRLAAKIRSRTSRAMAIRLADHSFKLAQPPLPALIRANKTNIHRTLIESTKQQILQLVQKDHITLNDRQMIKQLRDETEGLIGELNYEIRQKRSRRGSHVILQSLDLIRTSSAVMYLLSITFGLVCMILLYLKRKHNRHG